MIVIGYGTGRCGTKSLASFLNQQAGFQVTHESTRLGWYPELTDTDGAFSIFLHRMGDVIGDVGFYWIHYLDKLVSYNAKYINISRDDDEVIESFWKYKQPIPRVCKTGNVSRWYCYPYDSHIQDKDSIARTIKRYRWLEYEVYQIHKDRIFNIKMEDLNDKSKMAEMLDWLGVKGKKNLTKFHRNKRMK